MSSEKMRQLERLVGTWRVTGGAPGTVRYEKVDGGHFMFQHVELEQDGQVIKGMEVIGPLKPFMSEPTEDVWSRYYGFGSGDTLDYVYEPDGDTLTIWSVEKGSPAYFRGTWNEDGTVLDGAWVYPGGGGYPSTMTRVEE